MAFSLPNISPVLPAVGKPSLARYAEAAWNSLTWVVREQREMIAQQIEGTGHSKLLLLVPEQTHQRLSYTPRHVHLIGDRSLAQSILTRVDGSVEGGEAYSFLTPFLGQNSLFVLDGGVHKTVKQSIARLLAEDAVGPETLRTAFDEAIDRSIGPGEQNVLPALREILAGHRLQILFGKDLSDHEWTLIRNAHQGIDLVSGSLLMAPGLFRKSGRRRVSLRQIRISLRKYILRALLNDPALQQRFQPCGDPLPTSILVDNLLTVFVAGFETTAASISWTLAGLAEDIAEQSELVSELKARLTEPEDWSSYLQSNQTRLHKACLQSLRRHPPIPFILRRVKEHTQIGGISFSKHDYILLSIEAINKPHQTGKCPHSEQPASLMSFGGGVKFCPGRSVAMIEMKALLASFLLRYEVRKGPKSSERIRRNRITATPACAGNFILKPRNSA